MTCLHVFNCFIPHVSVFRFQNQLCRFMLSCLLQKPVNAFDFSVFSLGIRDIFVFFTILVFQLLGSGYGRWPQDMLTRMKGNSIFLFTTASRPALGPTQPPIQCVPGTLSLRVKWPGREADRSPPSCAKIKNEWSYTSTLQYALMAWYWVKKKHRKEITVCSESSELHSSRFFMLE
jgi:hypothetical protein